MKSQAACLEWAGNASEASAELLAPLEREVVLGDLAETDREDWRGLGDVLSLVALRQLELWRELAALGGQRGTGAAGESVPDGLLAGGERSDFRPID